MPWPQFVRSVLSKRQSDDPYGFVDSDDPDESANNPGFEELCDMALGEADGETQPEGNTTGVIDDPDSTFVYINDLANTYSLYADPDNGNLYIGNPGEGTTFAATSGFVIGDESGRYFHYYPDLVEKYEVSRFRLSNETTIPRDADFVSLAPVDYDNSSQTPDIYAAIDLSGNAFVTITCEIQGELSKYFLRRMPSQGSRHLWTRS